MENKDKIIAELKAENARLKEENFNFEEIVKLCRCEQYQQTLQEIKELINTCMEFRTCERCKFFKMCDKDLEGCILSLITKAESEG